MSLSPRIYNGGLTPNESERFFWENAKAVAILDINTPHKENTMLTYIFFMKGDQVFTLDSSAPDFGKNQKRLLDKGYIKQFEELQAVSPEAALARFKDIKGEEYKTESGFTSGAVFTSLIDVLLKKG